MKVRNATKYGSKSRLETLGTLEDFNTPGVDNNIEQPFDIESTCGDWKI